MTVREVELPAAIRQATALDRFDYFDSFLVTDSNMSPDTSPEALLREMIEGASTATRTSLHNGWRALGLRHGPLDSPDHILGWPIRLTNSGIVVVGARSWCGMPAELAVCRDSSGWVFATLVTHGNPVVRLLWRRIETAHRRIVQVLLAHAARRLASR